jgi:hypothetical protein
MVNQDCKKEEEHVIQVNTLRKGPNINMIKKWKAHLTEVRKKLDKGNSNE